ncbi:hypothetical protein L6164_007490 [Bauhinia variegata]|nr:hypothetical protein L6164_007490 [Bauhinia variegata]
MLNASTGNMIVIEGPRDLETIFQELAGKPGASPATKDSIEALPRVVVTDEGGECSICLEDYEVGTEACEMPCKHRFHSTCIEKWLGIHGTCPLCRFLMPVEEMEDKSSSSSVVEEESGGESLGIDEEIISVSVWVQARRSDSMDLDMELVPSSENTDSDSQHGNSGSEPHDSSRRSDSMDLDTELVPSSENTDGNSGSEAHDSSIIEDMDS